MYDFCYIQAKHLYGLLIGDAMNDYRWFYQQTQLSTKPIINRPIKCLACPQSAGTLTVSLDGNFGLVYKKIQDPVLQLLCIK